MENLTVTLETAKKLKEAGYPQDYTHAWYNHLIELVWRERECYANTLLYVAPTAQELADQLPMGVNLYKADNVYNATLSENPVIDGYFDTMAEALAALWLKLKESK